MAPSAENREQDRVNDPPWREHQTWFPDFCSPNTLLAVFIGTEVVALLIMLASSSLDELGWNEIGLKSALAQLIALWSAVLLCALKPMFNRLPVWAGSLVAYALILAMTALASACAYWLDRLLNLNVISPDSGLQGVMTANMTAVALVAAVALRYFYIQAQWRRDVESRARAQVDALQARIRPHFLFNSLNMIASLTRKNPADAERAIEDLSDLFRATLDGGNRQTTLADELTLCRRYLDLEQLRLGPRLTVEWTVDDLPGDQRVPPLLIQPLVENAVHHGIQHIGGGGTLHIGGGIKDKRWWIEISNPLPARRVENRAGAGMALRNIRKRLDHRYGGRATLTAAEQEQRFVVRMEAPTDSD